MQLCETCKLYRRGAVRSLANGPISIGDAFPQIVNIVNQPTVPTSKSIRGDELGSIAQTAAFHFAAIEQGGSSLYNSLITKVTNLDVVAILASIGLTEVYHFAVFQTALEGIRKLELDGGPSFPDIRENPNRGDIMPEPCTFLDTSAHRGSGRGRDGPGKFRPFPGPKPGLLRRSRSARQSADAALRS